MLRLARVVPLLLALTLSSAAVASAQTPATPGSTRNYAEFDFAATLGHKSDTAIRVAAAVGATANTISKIDYFDAGLRYHWPASASVDPYVAIGGGIAHVKNETTLSANNDLVQFGTDLNGSEVKPV